MNVDQIKQTLSEFMKKSYKDYNITYWQPKFDELIIQEKRSKVDMLIINELHVTRGELQTISSLNNNKLEKLAFVLLVYSKIYNVKNKNNTYWVNSDVKDVFSDCKVTLTKHKQELMIHELLNLGLVDTSRKVDCTNIRVNYSDNNDESAITITDFRDIVYYYLRWKGHNIVECSKCSRMFRKNKNVHKYCNACAKIIKNEQNKRYYNLGK